MVVYVEVPGNQAGEGNVREGFGRGNRLAGPREGTRVDIGEPKFGGAGAEASRRGINIEVKDLHRKKRTYREDGVKGQKTQGNIKHDRRFGGGGTKGLVSRETRQKPVS